MPLIAGLDGLMTATRGFYRHTSHNSLRTRLFLSFQGVVPLFSCTPLSLPASVHLHRPPAYLLHLHRPSACLTYPLPASYTTSALLPDSPTPYLPPIPPPPSYLPHLTSSLFPIPPLSSCLPHLYLLLPSGTPPSSYLHCLPFLLPPTPQQSSSLPPLPHPSQSWQPHPTSLLHASLLHHIHRPSYLVKYSCLAIPPA
ncbi:hypothetical protein Pcinc_040855 [Petrolisthes cinctipes]|uniref:Uncharacterized protein n=1 Tax=Petrolisthes cinctipes TaxID=88211 RepID=A0AAE1BL19_PETCI|nr:hypothetical protein Pcinc_040855 [Petrolisthes cinctipes]